MDNFDGNATVFEEDEEFDTLMSQVDEVDVSRLIEEKEEEENSRKRKAEEEAKNEEKNEKDKRINRRRKIIEGTAARADE
jgi:predicted SprT family Zn-dependent metalloprotease